MTDRAHYPSGEPGTTGREPFEEGDMQPGSLASRTTAGPTGTDGLATDAHGGTIARDTGVRDGQVVELAGPADSGPGVGAGSGAGLGAGAGAGIGAGVGAGLAGAGSHGHHDHSSGRGPNFGEEHSSVPGNDRSRPDRTGPLDQEAHKYESTGDRGPTTSGAANTDRFDAPSTGGDRNFGSSDTRSPPDVEHDDSHRKGTGGIGGILGTSDKDFTANPSRTGQGAYHDSDGHFQTNTSGPGGNTALTGREGTAEYNPVAQHKSRQEGQTGDASGEKPGLMDKVKAAFK